MQRDEMMESADELQPMGRAEWDAWDGLPMATHENVELAIGLKRSRQRKNADPSRVPRLQTATKLLRDFLRRGGAFVQPLDGRPLPFSQQRLAFDCSSNFLCAHNVRCVGLHLRRLANASDFGESHLIVQLTVELLADPEVALLSSYANALDLAEEHACEPSPELKNEQSKLVRAFRTWVLDRIAHMYFHFFSLFSLFFPLWFLFFGSAACTFARPCSGLWSVLGAEPLLCEWCAALNIGRQ